MKVQATKTMKKENQDKPNKKSAVTFPTAAQRCETCKHSMNYNKTCARKSGHCCCGMYLPHNFKIQ